MNATAFSFQDFVDALRKGQPGESFSFPFDGGTVQVTIGATASQKPPPSDQDAVEAGKIPPVTDAAAAPVPPVVHELRVVDAGKSGDGAHP